MNTRDEAAVVLTLFLLYLIALVVMGFPGGDRFGEFGDYVGLTILIGIGIVSLLCILSKVCDNDPTREKEMRRQIALESQRTATPSDEEQLE